MPVSKDHSFSSSHRIKTSSSSFLPIHDSSRSDIIKMRFAALLAVAALAVVTTAVPVTEGTCGEFCRDPTGKTGDDLVITQYVSGETIAGYCHCRVSTSPFIFVSLDVLTFFSSSSQQDLARTYALIWTKFMDTPIWATADQTMHWTSVIALFH